VEFKNSVKKDTKKSIRLLVSDGGGEFVNDKFKEFCTAKGIAHHVTPAYTPQNNGMAERANQAILTKARCLLVQSKHPKMFWSDAINTATQLSNLTPSNTRRMKVPYETWTGRKANLEARTLKNSKPKYNPVSKSKISANPVYFWE
jgi:transposase InsO family protein